MSLLNVINTLKALALDPNMLQAMESNFPGCKPAIDSINTEDIIDLQSSVDWLNKIESSINKANKKRKRVLTNPIDSTTTSDLAKIRRELDKVKHENVQHENVLLITKLQQSQQSLQTVSQRETENLNKY